MTLPPRFVFGLNSAEVAYNAGLAPTLTGVRINLIVVFVCTLTAAYDPADPSAYSQQPQSQQAAAAAAH